MLIPVATYRIQFNPHFRFEDAKNIVSYLADLGISDLYASPIFKARKGSTHGYDVVNPNQINPELGTPADYEALIAELQKRGMGWLQDIVPNHMAYNSENPFLMDVLENGPDSEYFDFFDINWEHPYEDIRNRVLTPLLGDFFGRCLENQAIQLAYDEYGLSVNYYDLKLPIRVETYANLVGYDLGRLARTLGRTHPDFIKMLGVLYLLKNIPSETSAQQRRDQQEFVKAILWELYQSNPEIKTFIDENLETFNGEKGKPESFDLLDKLLSEQFFRLSFWKVGAEEINYRRFFTVNELICVRVEDLRVFNQTHELISQLVESGKITGLRIDHIDGLYNPAEYLQRLRNKVGDFYIVVEKILEPGEELPEDWSVQGTSGYDFLSYINRLFVCLPNEQKFSDLYFRLTGCGNNYEQLFTEKKRLIADKNLAGDVDNLARTLKHISGQYRDGRDFTLSGLKRAILEVLVLFPVYRTYVNQLNSGGVSGRDRLYIQEALQKARRRVPELVNELNLIERFLLLEYDELLSEEDQESWLHFVMRIQQFSGPLMAKGVEDTLFYVYNRLISLNEVGSSPDRFGIQVKDFHQYGKHQRKNWQHSLNTTSTHDTKRSEDVRARLNVLSEIPEEWEAEVITWIELNRDRKQVIDYRTIPDLNDEYFLYQTLVGAFPFNEGQEYSQFIRRIEDYMIKAVREAKIHTAWLQPDVEYEQGFIGFIDKILEPNPHNEFLERLRAFHHRISFYGIFNSLAQTLIKLTFPGVPDFYQGSELWDLSLVDPDNRRPVNFEQRHALLKDLKKRTEQDILGLLAELLEQREDGRVKLFLIAQALAARKQNLEVFEAGDYLPLKLAGTYQDQVVAFVRSTPKTTAMVVVPRFLTHLIEPGEYPFGEAVWKDTMIQVPMGSKLNFTNVLTQQAIAGSDVMFVGEILQHFPVALLISPSSLHA